MKTIGAMMLFVLLVIITLGVWAGTNLSPYLVLPFTLVVMIVTVIFRGQGAREDEIMWMRYRSLCALAFGFSVWVSFLYSILKEHFTPR